MDLQGLGHAFAWPLKMLELSIIVAIATVIGALVGSVRGLGWGTVKGALISGGAVWVILALFIWLIFSNMSM